MISKQRFSEDRLAVRRVWGALPHRALARTLVPRTRPDAVEGMLKRKGGDRGEEVLGCGKGSVRHCVHPG